MRALPEPYASCLPQLLAAALSEDLPDLTAPAVFEPGRRLHAVLLVKAPGVICGLPAFAATFELLDGTCEVTLHTSDGDRVQPGVVAAEVRADACALLAGERTALNFVCRLSGIATLTAAFADAVAGTGCRVLDTRKTTPGWRRLEKHAVRAGGGTNHRMGLYDVAMLKDNHIDAAGSISRAVELVRARHGSQVPLVVECRTLEHVREARDCGVGHIMLDNMDIGTMGEAVREVAGRARLEASGGVRLDTVRAIASTGVDFVSVGALTHSAPALDLSLKVAP
jgi:nicotinate-nucleotide pyrophosphorylase (carboxylating)